MVTNGDSERSIYHSATIWLELKGEQALDEAGRMLNETVRRGDRRSADLWARIIAALEDLRARTAMDHIA
jgi:hypothetical protein